MDLIAADLERANSRVAAVERRNVSAANDLHVVVSTQSFYNFQEILRAEMESLRTGSDSVQRSESSAYVMLYLLMHKLVCRTQALEAQLAEADAEAQRLRVAFEELKNTTSTTIDTTEKRLSEVEKEANSRVSVYAL